jgi:23S rRNA pseudouridine1911/1915/1917 synthase
MEEIRRFTFEPGRSAERLDRFLADSLPELTRSQVKKLIDDGRVLLGGAPAKAGEKLKGGESLAITLPAAVPAEAQPEAILLRVLYEDRHLIVIDKPAGMVVHPAPGHQGGTLVNALLHHCQDLAGIGGELRPGIVHRLDKDTSGVMVAAKDDLTLNALARQFKAHSINRRYLALVHGLVPADRGTVDQPIGRHTTERKKMSGKTRSGRRAVTHWRVLRRFDRDRLTLVELTLETGRTHQIRVHFSEMNHPVAGDPVYGSSSRAQSLTDPDLRRRLLALHRQALHARVLGFIHPASGTYMEFESPLPEDLRAILDYLEIKYRHEA